MILLEIYFREVSHPFIVSLLWSYKDSHCLYMLFPYICGGELFSHLRNTNKVILWFDVKCFLFVGGFNYSFLVYYVAIIRG